MKINSILAIGLLAVGVSAHASHDLIKQPVAQEAKVHYDMHDLKQWLTGYPQVNLSVSDGVATATGHVENVVDAKKVVSQVEKTAGIRRVINLMGTD